MAKVENYKSYFEELAKKAGLSDEQAKPILEALSNEAVHKAFKDGFKATPDYSFDLDQVKGKTREESIAEAKAYYDNWFAKEANPAHQKNLQIAKEYDRYVQTYGPLDGNNAGNPSYLTKEEATKMVSEALSQHGEAYAGLTKKAMKIAAEHLHRFGEVLDPDVLEKFANDNKFTDVNVAYKAFVEPRIKETETKQHQEELKKAREEGAKDALSRRVADGGRSREYVNPFLKQTPKSKDGDVSPETAARNAFMDGWSTHKET